MAWASDVITVFAVVIEALTNVVMHAHAADAA